MLKTIKKSYIMYYSNTGSANGESLGQDYLFVWPITNGERESCLKTVI